MPTSRITAKQTAYLQWLAMHYIEATTRNMTQAQYTVQKAKLRNACYNHGVVYDEKSMAAMCADMHIMIDDQAKAIVPPRKNARVQ